MAGRAYTPYQRKVIQRYYDHRDQIVLDRLGQIVTDLALAGSDQQRSRLWKRAEQAMRALKVPEPVVLRLLEAKRVELLARHVKEWLRDAARPGKESGP